MEEPIFELRHIKEEINNSCECDFHKANNIGVGNNKELCLHRLGYYNKSEGARTLDAFEIVRMCFDEPTLTHRTVEDVLKANERFYLISNNGGTVGCISFEPSTGKLGCVFIKPDFRGSGHMKKVLKVFIRCNSNLKLATNKENKPMNELVKSLGFKAQDKLIDNCLVYRLKKNGKKKEECR